MTSDGGPATGAAGAGAGAAGRLLGHRSLLLHWEVKRHQAWWKKVLDRGLLTRLAEHASSKALLARVCVCVCVCVARTTRYFGTDDSCQLYRDVVIGSTFFSTAVPIHVQYVFKFETSWRARVAAVVCSDVLAIHCLS